MATAQSLRQNVEIEVGSYKIKATVLFCCMLTTHWMQLPRAGKALNAEKDRTELPQTFPAISV
jgi:hypothetical protein